MSRLQQSVNQQNKINSHNSQIDINPLKIDFENKKKALSLLVT